MSPSPIVRGGLAAWLAGGAEAAPCRELCTRTARKGRCDPVPDRPVSWDGIRLCLRFCRGFAARRNSIVVRRPRRRANPTESVQ